MDALNLIQGFIESQGWYMFNDWHNNELKFRKRNYDRYMSNTDMSRAGSVTNWTTGTFDTNIIVRSLDDNEIWIAKRRLSISGNIYLPERTFKLEDPNSLEDIKNFLKEVWENDYQARLLS